MDWVMSEGGPLICMESRFESSWRGIHGISVPEHSATSDYERACVLSNYTYVIPISGGMALVLGTGPLHTAVWRDAEGINHIISIEYAEPDIDEPGLLSRMSKTLFDNPKHVKEFNVLSSNMVIFDSSDSGLLKMNKDIRFNLRPSKYKIITIDYELPDAAFIVHKIIEK